MTWQPLEINVQEHREHVLSQLAKALDFLDRCKCQPNSGETGAYRDALEWLESAARDVIESLCPQPLGHPALAGVVTNMKGLS